MRIVRYTGLLWFLAAAEFVLMLAMEFFLFRRLSGGLPSLDMRPGFSTGDVTQWLTALGPQGAETVLVWHYMTFDLLFPALLGLALAAGILSLGQRLPRFAALKDWTKLAFAGVLVLPYVFFDYAQNWSVMKLLRDTFNVDPVAVAATSSLNQLKFVFLALPFVVIALFALAGQKGRRKA